MKAELYQFPIKISYTLMFNLLIQSKRLQLEPSSQDSQLIKWTHTAAKMFPKETTLPNS